MSLEDICLRVWKNRDKDYKFPPTDRRLFFRKGLVYYLRFENDKTGERLYKIGFTSTGLEYRVFRMGVAKGWKVSLIDRVIYPKGSYGYAIEQLLHQADWIRKERYRGKGILANGNSEVYRVDVLGLDKERKGGKV